MLLVKYMGRLDPSGRCAENDWVTGKGSPGGQPLRKSWPTGLGTDRPPSDLPLTSNRQREPMGRARWQVGKAAIRLWSVVSGPPRFSGSAGLVAAGGGSSQSRYYTVWKLVTVAAL